MSELRITIDSARSELRNAIESAGQGDSDERSQQALMILEGATTRLQRKTNQGVVWDADMAHVIGAVSQCLPLLAPRRTLDIAVALGKHMIDLLPKLVNYSNCLEVAVAFSGVASNLCSLLIQENNVIDAIEYLERGRATVLSQFIDDQDHDCRAEGSGGCGLLNKAKELAGDGFIVLINSTQFRSDAIVISRREVKTVKLPDVDASRAEQWLKKEWLSPRGRDNHRKLDEFLGWLWDFCVGQIIAEVRQTTSSLPRVCWIGSGLTCAMPFHAARHGLDIERDALTSAISSRAPSLKTLLANQGKRGEIAGRRTMFIGHMPQTPPPQGAGKWDNLAGVSDEVISIQRVVGHDLSVQVLKGPSVEQVVEWLRDCQIVHCACHGSADGVNPLDSGIALQRLDDKGRPVEDRLTAARVLELAQLGEPGQLNAHLAYLSACSTAENRPAALSNEELHLASALMVAGVPHIIACLWATDDEICVEVAAEFYASLLGQSEWDPAAALREAVVAVRRREFGSRDNKDKKNKSDMPLFWAQFVHYGT